MKVLRKSSVAEKVGLSTVHISRLAKAGRFPSPLRLGPASIGWLEDEIDEWIQQKADLRLSPPVDEPLPDE